MLAILLTCCAAVTQAPTTTAELLDSVRKAHPELFTAPAVEGWPQGLPVPLKTPAEARCVDVAGKELGLGAWLPVERAAAVAKRLRRLEVYPGQAQARLDELVGAIGDRPICEVAGDGASASAREACDERCERPPDGFSLGSIVTWAALGLAFGMAVGAAGTAALLTR